MAILISFFNVSDVFILGIFTLEYTWYMHIMLGFVMVINASCIWKILHLIFVVYHYHGNKLHDNLKIIFASPSNLRRKTEKILASKKCCFITHGEPISERHNAFAVKLQKIIIKLTLDLLELWIYFTRME